MDPRRVEQNPFYVLGLRPDATRARIEHQGQMLLQMLELGSFEDAAHYMTPLGERVRTPELVRQAVHELRDGERRLRHEFWAMLVPVPLPLPPPHDSWQDAPERFGW
ncbi:MAG: hypothetical protein ACYCW6_19720 [Candidatus Xenobia bacterium]